LKVIFTLFFEFESDSGAAVINFPVSDHFLLNKTPLFYYETIVRNFETQNLNSVGREGFVDFNK